MRAKRVNYRQHAHAKGEIVEIQLAGIYHHCGWLGCFFVGGGCIGVKSQVEATSVNIATAQVDVHVGKTYARRTEVEPFGLYAHVHGRVGGPHVVSGVFGAYRIDFGHTLQQRQHAYVGMQLRGGYESIAVGSIAKASEFDLQRKTEPETVEAELYARHRIEILHRLAAA